MPRILTKGGHRDCRHEQLPRSPQSGKTLCWWQSILCGMHRPAGRWGCRMFGSSSREKTQRAILSRERSTGLRQQMRATISSATYRVQYSTFEAAKLSHHAPRLQVNESDDEIVTYRYEKAAIQMKLERCYRGRNLQLIYKLRSMKVEELDVKSAYFQIYR